MDKNKTQRVVGILVVMSVVVIILPLLFGRDDITPQRVSVSAPPFPDQKIAGPAVAVVAEAKPTPVPVAVTKSPAAVEPNVVALAKPEPVTPSDTKVPANNTVIVSASIAKKLNAPSAPNTDISLKQDALNEKQYTTLAQAFNNNTEDTQAPVKKETVVKHVVASNQKTPKLGWAIQMGCFKNKANADKLALRLQAAGFKTIQKNIKVRNLAMVKVFVKPTSSSVSATKLATKVTADTHLHGIVVSYHS
jgi:cell division septation protein DedD